MAFVEAGFKGQLPQPYFELEGGTRLLQNNFNDLNLEEPTRYIPKEECHYLIDMDIGEHDSHMKIQSAGKQFILLNF